MTVILNPGTGPVEGACLERARACVTQLVADVRQVAGQDLPILVKRYPSRDRDGRYGFRRAIDELAAIARAYVAHGPVSSSQQLDVLVKTEKLQRLEFDS